jgi:hypothetical protein
VLWLKPEVEFQFIPGQYITIGAGGIERPYSIVSAPYEPHIELFIEYLLPEHGGKLTPLLHAQHVGDMLTIRLEETTARRRRGCDFQSRAESTAFQAVVSSIAADSALDQAKDNERKSRQDGLRPQTEAIENAIRRVGGISHDSRQPCEQRQFDAADGGGHPTSAAGPR